MIKIEKTQKGFDSNQEITSKLFEQTGNEIIDFVCNEQYYTDVHTLENAICDYLTSFMSNGIVVKRNNVILYQCSEYDVNGNYIKKLVFQVYI